MTSILQHRGVTAATLMAIALTASVIYGVGPSGAATAYITPQSESDNSGLIGIEHQGSAHDPGDLFIALSGLRGFQSGGVTNTRGFEFYWHGDLPEAALDLIEQTETRGIPVRIITVKYSESELWGYMRNLATALGSEGIVLSGYGPGNRDNTVVEYMGPELSHNPELQARAKAIADTILPNDITLKFSPHETPVTF
jgi:hypothetical protein